MRHLAVVLGLGLGLVGTSAALATELPSLNIVPDGVTASGISSGGYMANQFHLAHGERVHGVGIIAAGPYECARNSLATALGQCFDKPESKPPVDELLALARARAAKGELAPLTELRDDPVWLFHGTVDTTVATSVSDALHAFYGALVAPEKLHYVNDQAAGHGFPTLSYGKPCTAHEDPFINACGFDGAGEILKHLYGKLEAPVATNGQLQRFEQKPYAPDGKLSLADEGYAYVPVSCAKGEPCRLHIVFHGCRQNAASVGETFVREAGYNRWAESNHIVVLYPQTKASMLPLNPKACWDWWGYTGAQYATRGGNQIMTVWNMARALGMKP